MKISLLYCGNRKVFDGMVISALSVAKYTDCALDVHLCTADFTERNPSYLPITISAAEKLETVLQVKNAGSTVTLHDVKALFMQYMGCGKNLDTSYTPYTLLRLVADKADLPDRVLYLDTDTTALADIRELFSFEMEGYDFAGARDHLGQIFIGRNYMNAGVLLLNLKHLRTTNGLDKVRKLCNCKKWAFPDQDALNHADLPRRFLPRRYNEQKKQRKDTVIRHFSKTIRWLPFFHTVNVKPWQIAKLHRVYRMHELDDVLAEYEDLMKNISISE